MLRIPNVNEATKHLATGRRNLSLPPRQEIALSIFWSLLLVYDRVGHPKSRWLTRSNTIYFLKAQELRILVVAILWGLGMGIGVKIGEKGQNFFVYENLTSTPYSNAFGPENSKINKFLIF